MRRSLPDQLLPRRRMLVRRVPRLHDSVSARPRSGEMLPGLRGGCMTTQPRHCPCACHEDAHRDEGTCQTCFHKTPTWAAVREALITRDGPNCQLCGEAFVPPAKGTFDHIIPRSLGGRHVLSNLRLAHAKCNMARGSVVVESRDLVRP